MRLDRQGQGVDLNPQEPALQGILELEAFLRVPGSPAKQPEVEAEVLG